MGGPRGRRTGTLERMEITPLDADDAGTLDQVVDLLNADRALDAPWQHPVTALQPAQPDPARLGRRARRLLRRRRGRPGGRPPQLLRALVGQPGAGLAEPHGPPGAPAVGAWATEGLRFLLDRAAAAGRTKLGADSWDGSPGNAFLEKHGFTRGSQAINRRQHLAEVSLDDVPKLYDEAAEAASAYELVRVVGATPHGPHAGGGRDVSGHQRRPARRPRHRRRGVPAGADHGVRAGPAGQRDALLPAARAAPRDRRAGRPHAWWRSRPSATRSGTSTTPRVVRSHRGHRLGLLLKAAMILWLAEAEPQLETVDTWNAESNDHMIAVNEVLGYRWMGRELQYMLPHRPDRPGSHRLTPGAPAPGPARRRTAASVRPVASSSRSLTGPSTTAPSPTSIGRVRGHEPQPPQPLARVERPAHRPGPLEARPPRRPPAPGARSRAAPRCPARGRSRRAGCSWRWSRPASCARPRRVAARSTMTSTGRSAWARATSRPNAQRSPRAFATPARIGHQPSPAGVIATWAATSRTRHSEHSDWCLPLLGRQALQQVGEREPLGLDHRPALLGLHVDLLRLVRESDYHGSVGRR